MNIDTGHVISGEEYTKLDLTERDRYVQVTKDLVAAAHEAHEFRESLFNGKHFGQRVQSRALDLARKAKAKQRRKAAKASRKRNRA